MTTRAEALALLSRMVAADKAPVLDATALGELLDAARRRDLNRNWYASDTPWAANTALAVGTTIVPTDPTGVAYVVTVAGVTGGVEPVWPAAGNVVSGTVTFSTLLLTGERALVWQPTYDLNTAAAEGWRWKAAQVSAQTDFASDGQSFSLSQRVKAFMDMAAQYAKRAGTGAFGGATIPLGRQRQRVILLPGGPTEGDGALHPTFRRQPSTGQLGSSDGFDSDLHN
jgi:hypothetical protein